jgi:predicted esterase YcpF (UPF0227 family)
MIVYFHGLGSSPNSDKVDRLKAMFPNKRVYAFSANVDPEIACKEVADQIESAMIDHLHEPGKVYFIGTSLGAWLAAKMGDLFKVKVLLINPCYDPVESLKKYPGVSDEIRNKYTKIRLQKRMDSTTCAVDPYDPIIDMRNLMQEIGDQVTLFPGVGHRFNGPEFETFVTSGIKE